MHDDKQSENSVQTFAEVAFKVAQVAGAIILALESFAFAVYLWRQHRKFCVCGLVTVAILVGYMNNGCLPIDASGFGPWDPVKQEYVRVPWYRNEFNVETASVFTLIVFVCVVGRDTLLMLNIGFLGMLRLSKASTKTRKRLKRIKKAQERIETEMAQGTLLALAKELRIGRLAGERDRRAECRKPLRFAPKMQPSDEL